MTTNRRPLDMLHELMDSDPIENSIPPLPEDTDTDTEVISEALARVGLDALSPEAQRLLLALTDDVESVEPSTRQRLVSAADRGIQRRRDERSALPRLLFLARRRAEATLEDIADRIDVPADTLDAVERGKELIDTMRPEQVAAWIRSLHVGAEQARESLRRAFRLRREQDLAVASASPEVTADQDAFVNQVMALLQAEQR
jgi:hypothetical protein